MADTFEIFLVTPPGLERFLADEARAAGFSVSGTIPGGVTLNGGWPEVWRANLSLRGATRVLARVAAFRALHLAQLDKRSRKLPWKSWLRADVPVKVEATCRKSRIYHAGAATQRIERALTESAGVTLSKDAALVVKVRIEDDLCTVSLDTSGEPLHKRGHKEQVNKAPMRESMAALFLRACGYDGTEPVLDPMCGSGTFPVEAAEIASGLLPGRTRGFAFEQLASFDAKASAAMKTGTPGRDVDPIFFGSDRDQGAIQMSRANAARAGVSEVTTFETRQVSEIVPPCNKPGLVIVNPPYGGRIGNKKLLFGLYAALGARLKSEFRGWRVGIVTSDAGLVRATGLSLAPPGPVIAHGGLKVRLWQADL